MAMPEAYQTDFDLICQIRARDRRAYFLLKDRYQHRILMIARELLPSPHQADQVVRKVFEQSWRRAAEFDIRRERSVALWLYGLTQDVACLGHKRWGSPPAGDRWGSGWMLILWFLVAGLSLSTGISLWRWQRLSQLLSRVSVADPRGSQDLQITYQQWQQQPLLRRLTLRDPRLQTDVLAQLLWLPSEHRALLLGTQVPTVHPGLTYQLWTYGSDPNQPIGVGTFFSAADGTVQWLSEPWDPTVTEADPDYFWVTLEPLGGSDYPTGLPLLESRAF